MKNMNAPPMMLMENKKTLNLRSTLDLGASAGC